MRERMRRQLLATHLEGINFVEAADCSSFFQKATPAVLTGQDWVPLLPDRTTRPAGQPDRPDARQLDRSDLAHHQLICLNEKKSEKRSNG